MKKNSIVISWLVAVLVFLFLQTCTAQYGQLKNVGVLFPEVATLKMFGHWFRMNPGTVLLGIMSGTVCGFVVYLILEFLGWCLTQLSSWIAGLAGKKVIDPSS